MLHSLLSGITRVACGQLSRAVSRRWRSLPLCRITVQGRATPEIVAGGVAQGSQQTGGGRGKGVGGKQSFRAIRRFGSQGYLGERERWYGWRQGLL